MDKYNKVRKNVSRTYTAHLMTTDIFLQLAFPGKRIDAPFKKYWPKKSYIRTYVIPHKIDTFLFSPFTEARYSSYYINKYGRYIIPKNLRNEFFMSLGKEKTKLKKIKGITIKKFIEDLKEINKKIIDIWNPKNKILIFYDNMWAPPSIKSRLILFDKIAKETLGWEHIQVVGGMQCKPHKNDMWQHYDRTVYINLYNQISKLEEMSVIK